MSLRRTPKGKWEYRFKLAGHPRVTKVTPLEATEGNRSKALKLEQQHRDSILKGEAPARKPVARGFTEASKEFIEWCEMQHAGKKNTVHRIVTSMWSLREWFKAKAVAMVRASDIERYKVWRLQTHKVQPITLRHDLDALSKFFRWAKVMELRADNPVAEVAKPSTENAVRMHILTAAEELRYFHRCSLYGYENLADLARLILDQGMRPEEVMSLERRGVDLELGRVRIFEGKTNAAKRTLKLTAEARLIVERRYQEAEAGRWLFPSPKIAGAHLTKLNNSHNAVCEATEDGPELAFVLYDLRHTFATRAAERGMDLATLARILGHSSLRMVMKYVHPSQDHMDSEMDRIGKNHEKTTTIVEKTHFVGSSGNKRDVVQ